MTRRRRKTDAGLSGRSLPWLAAIAGVVCALPAAAETAQPFNVPPQNLSTALAALADQAGVQVVFVGADVKGHLSLPVRGTMTASQAFRRAAGDAYDVVAGSGDVYAVRLRTLAVRPAPHPRPHIAQPPAPKPVPDPEPPAEDVIITARMGITARTRLDSSYAVTRLNASAIDMSGALSAADLLKAVPGLWVESSGGEASNNIRARGIPRDGYSSIAVLEDGLPVQHDPGLGYLNADQSFRIDDTLSAVEVVRGGPAAVFASNALGGLINLIPRQPPEHAALRIKLQSGDGDYRRVDIWGGGPVGAHWRLAAGGFYRSDDGLRPTGYPADRGGQGRISARRVGDHSTLDLDWKHLDDSVAFYLPVPVQLSDGEIVPVPGFDPRYGTLAGPETAHIVLRDARGAAYPFDLTRGTSVRLDQYTARLRTELSDTSSLTTTLRYRRSSTWRNGLFPGYPAQAADKLQPYLAAAQALHPGTTRLGLAYRDGTAYPDKALAIDATLSSVRIPLNEVIGDSQYAGHIAGHSFTLGIYGARADLSMQRLTATTLLDVRSQARPLDIVAFDAAGHSLGTITRDGITRYGAQYDNTHGTEQSLALYGTDEWNWGAWRGDLGVRLEQLTLDARIEQSQSFAGPDAAHIGDDAVLGGTGIFTFLHRTFTGQTVSFALARPIGEGTQVYGRVTRTQYLPNLTDLTSYPSDPLHSEPVLLTEAGFTHATPRSDLHVVAFTTAFSGYRVTDNIFEAATNTYRQKVVFSDTLTAGVEIEGLWRLRRSTGPDLTVSATVQDARFQSLRYTEIVKGIAVAHDFSHNRLVRVPQVMARITPGYGFARGRVEATVELYGDRYADAANTAHLPAYAVLNAAVRYDLTPRLTLILTGDNLGQTLGLTEGNPRAGQLVSGDADATTFAARPIFGRTFRASLSWRM